ncbi:hypothetical protein M408DRAFT_306241 [Serendipita vermifera MAFF 305830]|uniref:Uncharacterized protein n=1 Tax=Serendipita vermifera MAFF 305830 TaxID=933852 RepID=A0A0C3AXK5_SERVB|nr:hypothetical protein M408DRAFT_306241 [Serendipita vermifera MAFF 305830]
MSSARLLTEGCVGRKGGHDGGLDDDEERGRRRMLFAVGGKGSAKAKARGSGGNWVGEMTELDRVTAKRTSDPDQKRQPPTYSRLAASWTLQTAYRNCILQMKSISKMAEDERDGFDFRGRCEGVQGSKASSTPSPVNRTVRSLREYYRKL